MPYVVCFFYQKSEDDPRVDTYAHSGNVIRVQPKTMKNDKFEKMIISLKNSSPDSKAVFVRKSLLGLWRLILSRYDIILSI